MADESGIFRLELYPQMGPDGALLPTAEFMALPQETQEQLMSMRQPAETIGMAQEAGFRIPNGPPIQQEPERRSPFLQPGLTEQQANSFNSLRIPGQSAGPISEGQPALQPPPAQPIAAPAGPSYSLSDPPATTVPPGTAGGPGGDGSLGFSIPMGGPGGGVPGLSGRELRDAYKTAQQKTIEAAGAAQAQIAAQAAAQEELVRTQERQALQFQEQEQRRQQAMSEGRKRYDDAVARQQTPEAKLNPDRYWANKNTGQKVLAGLAIVLGGLGQGLTGGPNQALGIIQKQIDDDIDAQKSDLAAEREKKRDAVSGASNMLSMLRAEYQDDRAAESALRAMQLGAVKDMITAKTLASSSEVVRAHGEQAAAQIGIQQAQQLSDLDARNAQLQMQREQLGLQRMELGIKMSAKTGGDPETYVPGVGYARNKEAAKHVAESAEVYDGVKDLLTRLRTHREKFGTETANREAVEAGRTMATDLMTMLLKEKKLGSLDNGSQAVLMGLTGGDPDRFGHYLTKLEQLEKGVETRWEATKKYNLLKREDPQAIGQSLGFKELK